MSSEVQDFRQVFDATYGKIVAYVGRRVAEPSAAEDVVAETFLVAWRRRLEVLAMENPLPWMYRVAANQIRNQHRGSNRHLRLVAKVAAEPAAQAVADSITNGTDLADDPGEVLRGALSRLSDDDQEVLRLVAWEELSYAEAAVALECSVDAVAQRLRRAKQRLAQALTPEAV